MRHFSEASNEEAMSPVIKIVIGVVVVVVLGIVAFALFSGGDDNDEPKSASTTSSKSADKDDDSGSKSDSDEPALRTLVVKRASGKNAAAQAGALVQKPDEIWIRVSAAPKQETRVTWSLACGGGSASQDNYLVTPPHQRQLKVPDKAKTCAGSVAAQLAKAGATGRVKVALLVNR
jgi:hypothetical protein